MKVEPLSGEHGLRYFVESRSDPMHPHVVDLSCNDGYGECSCKNWQCNVWPAIRDRTHEKHRKETTCAHVRVALRFFLQMTLKMWIDEYGQEKPSH